jgi:hypothetical protein
MLYLEEKIKNQIYIISLKSTGIIVGEFIKIDGFYYFSENKNRTWGYWSEEFLVSLANELKKLNRPVNKSAELYFLEKSSKRSHKKRKEIFCNED